MMVFGLAVTLQVSAQTGQNANGEAEPCDDETGPHYGPWSCTTGSVNDPGTLSKTEDVICVCDSSSASVSGTTFNDGSKSREVTYDCPENEPYTDGPYPISYSATSWFEPPIPESFPDCGIFSFTAKVKGISGDSDCPDDTDTVTVGTFTVKVVAVTSLAPNLSPSEGTKIPGTDEPAVYRVCPCGGDVTVMAGDCPGLNPSELPGCWTFTGGVEIDRKTHKVAKSSLLNGPVTFTVTAGCSTKTVILKEDPSPRGLWNLVYFDGQIECASGQQTPARVFGPQYDCCSNKLEIWCQKPNPQSGAQFHYKYNGVIVGSCIYNGGIK